MELHTIGVIKPLDWHICQHDLKDVAARVQLAIAKYTELEGPDI